MARVFLFALTAVVASMHARVAAGSDDVSAPGKYATVEFEFPSLIDAARDDRKTPMKLHLPDGEGPFPAIVISHGAGGNWDANFAQARHFASHGYAAICLEHVGSNTKSALAGGSRIGKTVAAMTRDSDEVLNRPKDVSFAIDQIGRWHQDHDKLRGKFDLNRIGAMGHSFGAFTTLVVSGARPALDWMQPKIGAGSGLGPDLFDKRVRCAVALSPQGPGDPFFLPTSYETIRIPLFGISGSRDKQQNFEPEHRKRGFELWPPGDRYLLWISKANHLMFSDNTGSRRWNQKKAAANALLSRREGVQKVSRAATLLFFDKYLKKLPNATLSEEELENHVGGFVNDIELLVK